MAGRSRASASRHRKKNAPSPSGEWRASEHTDFPYDEGYSVYQAPDDGGQFGTGAYGGRGHEGRVAWADNAAIGAAIALAHNVLPLAVNAFEAVRKVHDRDHHIAAMLGLCAHHVRFGR